MKIKEFTREYSYLIVSVILLLGNLALSHAYELGYGLTDVWIIKSVFIAPIIEECYKRLYNRKCAYLFGVIESALSYPETFLLRLVTTNLMHSGTRKHGLITAIIMHMAWNYTVNTLDLNNWVVGGLIVFVIIINTMKPVKI